MTASQRPLQVGLIGLGRMGRLHARVLRALPGVSLAATVDPAGDRFHAAGDLPVLPDLDTLLHRHRLDYAVLASPTAQHESLGVALAAAGIPTLIEKPLASTPDAARRLVNAFHHAGIPAAVGYVERFNPALIQLAARLRNGQLGEIFEISTRRIGPFPPRVTDIGVVHDLATHDIDLTTWVSGQHYKSISARTAHRSGRPHEDLLAALGRLTDGTIVHHRVNWLSPMKERITTVTGEDGCLIANTLTADLTYYANGAQPTQWDALSTFRGVTEGDIIRYAIPKKEPLIAEHENFRDSILNHHPPAAPLRDGLHPIQVAHTALQAAQTGTTLSITSCLARFQSLRSEYIDQPNNGVRPFSEMP
jgi:predicted dehydrogenase